MVQHDEHQRDEEAMSRPQTARRAADCQSGSRGVRRIAGWVAFSAADRLTRCPGKPGQQARRKCVCSLEGEPLTRLDWTPWMRTHLQRFAGIGRLYGRAGMERLARASFLVVGLGGVGSWTVEALARSGVGSSLAMVDGDSQSASPTRTVSCTRSRAMTARPKTEVIAERARSIHPADPYDAPPALPFPLQSA
jgi:hypothetical protein